MRANENGSKRLFVVVNPQVATNGSSRPAKSFTQSEGNDPLTDACSYALEGDALLEVFEDGSVYHSYCGAKSGAVWGSSIAEVYLYGEATLEKTKLLELCTSKDTEARDVFLSELVDYVVACREDVRGW